MISTIIFDLGGVLLDLDMDLCFQRVKALGIDMDKLTRLTQSVPLDSEAQPQGATICDGVTCSGILHLYQIGKATTDELVTTLLKMSHPGTTYQQVLDAWNSCLLTIPQYKLDFIKELRQEGYHTYLLSNTNDAHWQYCEKNVFHGNTSDYFDKLFLSQEMGLAKPNTEIYKAVLKQINTPADECLFLDDAKENCDAAGRLGIHTYHTPLRVDFRDTIRTLLSSFLPTLNSVGRKEDGRRKEGDRK